MNQTIEKERQEFVELFELLIHPNILQFPTQDKNKLFNEFIHSLEANYIFYELNYILESRQKNDLKHYWQNNFPSEFKFANPKNQTFPILIAEQLLFFVYDQLKQHDNQDFIDGIDGKQFKKIFLLGKENRSNFNFLYLLINDKQPEFFSNNFINNESILHQAIIENNHSLTQHILKKGIQPDIKNNDHCYATAYVQDLAMAQLCSEYDIPFFNQDYPKKSAAVVIQNENQLSKEFKEFNEFIVNQIKQETGNPDIGAFYCLQYLKTHPYQKYFKKHYTLAKPKNLNYQFNYNQKKASLLEHMLDFCIADHCMEEDRALNVKNTEFIISKQQANMSQIASDQYSSLLPYVCFIKQDTVNTFDGVLNRAANELYTTVLNKMQKQSNYLSTQQFKQDIQFCNQSDFNQKINIKDFYSSSKSCNNLFHQNILLYFLYKNQKNASKADNNKNLNVLFDFLLEKEKTNKETIDQIISNNDEQSNNKIKQDFVLMYQKHEQEKYFLMPDNNFESDLLDEIKENQDSEIKQKYFDLNVLIYTNSLLINQFFVNSQYDHIKQKNTVQGIIQSFDDNEIKDQNKYNNLSYLKDIYNKTLQKNSIHPELEPVFRLMEQKQLKEQTIIQNKMDDKNQGKKKKNKML